MARKAKKSEIDEAKVAPDADDAGPEPATATTGDDHDHISTDSTTAAKVDAPPPTPSKPHKKSAKKSKRTSTKKSKKKSEGDDSASSKKKKKKEKRQFPPPFPDLIYGYHANDVLNGRGASVNVHPGNKKFRDLCISRKEEFNSARNIQKRDIAIEIVQTVLEWNPPGRFLERTNDSNHRNHSNNNPGDAEVEAYFNEVNAAEVLTGASALYFNQMGISARKNSKFMRELGPWKDMGMERAIQKVCGVIRDHKRPDRLALQAMALSKVKNVVARKTIDNVSSHCC